MPDLNWTAPGPVAAEFFKDENFVVGIRGPVGSGKSVACCLKLFVKCAAQAPSKLDGKRYSRVAIVRNTNPQLKTTTIKTWLEWFPEAEYGKFNWSVPYTHHIRVGDIDCEVIFLSLDRPEDVRKLLSMDLTWVWINEAREVHKDIIDGTTMRVGRYPSMRHGGPSNYGVLMDTNAPDDNHWWAIMSGAVPVPDYLTHEEALTLVKPDNWSFYDQPGAMNEVRDELGALTGYEPNPKAENAHNLPPRYYLDMIQGKRKNWIDVYVRNVIGGTFNGRAVYAASFRKETHVSPSPLNIDPNVPVRLGIDFGRTPAAVLCQHFPNGRWHILRELVTRNMGARRFGKLLKVFVNGVLGPDFASDVSCWGDPRGDDMTQADDHSPMFILRTSSGLEVLPAPTNDPVVRIEAVEGILESLIEGRPQVVIDPRCTSLIRGFEQGYHYEEKKSSGESDSYKAEAKKNRYSHVHDALQYVCVGEGEGNVVLVGQNSKVTAITSARKQRHMYDRLKRSRRRAR